MNPLSDPAPRRRNTAAIAALGLALAGGLLVLVSGMGAAQKWWHFGTGFTLLRYGAYLCLLAALVALASLGLARRRGGVLFAAAALLIAFPAVYVPWSMQRTARSVPPIHDITTDTENPPAFVALVAVRQADGAPNPVDYPGEEVARQQRQAYPDVVPVMLAMAPDSAFRVAYRVAEEMGWDVAAADAGEGRVEATATTRWFGFKDDVVIRLRPASGITRLDIRSKSRVGGSDVGANAARIRRYVARLPGRAVVE